LEARERAATDLANFLRALHAIPVAIGGECGLEQLDGAELRSGDPHRGAEPLCRRDAPALLSEIRKWYLLDAVVWREPAAGAAW
jgi:aminoglycoside phosphotransferase (APT) family kinase protein